MALGIASRTPLHVRALALYMMYTFIMATATINGLQVALPTISREFDVPVTTVAWINIAYSVALTGGTFALGGITTYFEKRALVVVGIVADILLMTTIFFTHSIMVFIICRFLSSMFRVFPWLILQVEGVGGFPPEQRGKAVGYNTLMTGLGMMISLPLTGFVVDHIGWRWLFMGSNVAFGLMIPLVYLLLPKMPTDPANRRRLSDFDLQGSALMMVGMVSLISSLQVFSRGLGSGPLVIVLATSGVLMLAAFVWVELHARSPIINFSLFKIAGVSQSASQSVIMGFTNGVFMLILPFLFTRGFGWTAAYVSSILFFQNLTRPAAGPIAGRLADRFGNALVVLPAGALAVAGQVALASMGVDTKVTLIIAALLFWGTGQALMQTANLRQIYASLPTAQLHLAPSINLVMMTMGGTTGQAVGSLAVENAKKAAGAGSAFVSYLGDTMILVSIGFAIAMLATQLVPRIFLHPDPVPPPTPAMASEPEETASG